MRGTTDPIDAPYCLSHPHKIDRGTHKRKTGSHIASMGHEKLLAPHMPLDRSSPISETPPLFIRVFDWVARQFTRRALLRMPGAHGAPSFSALSGHYGGQQSDILHKCWTFTSVLRGGHLGTSGALTCALIIS